MTERGYIALARGTLDHPIVGCGPGRRYSPAEAWQWLLFEAAWKPRRYSAGGIVIELKRGQLAHSTRYMAQAWRWSETHVRRFLERLETGAGTGAMIGADTGAGITVITICNYERYQSPQVENGADSGAPDGAGRGAKVAHDRRRKEEGNNEKKMPTANAALPSGDPKTQLYQRGVEVLGENSGGIVTDLLKAKGTPKRRLPWKRRPRKRTRASTSGQSSEHKGAGHRRWRPCLRFRPMKTAAEILGAAGIILRRFSEGNSKTLCPHCSHLRRKRREPCLSVDINERGVRWRCHNGDCGWHGGEFYNGSSADFRSGSRNGFQPSRNIARDSRAVRNLYG